MDKSGSNLLFLAVGAAIGAAVGYIAACDKRNELLQNVVDCAHKVKDNLKTTAKDSKQEIDETIQEVSKDLDAE